MKQGKAWIGWLAVIMVVLGAWWLTSASTLTLAEEPKTTTATPEATKESSPTKTPTDKTTPSSRRKILGASLLIGRSLYSYEEMGNNGKSCKSCHQQGQSTQSQPWKQKSGETYMDGKMSLVKAINYCITTRQGGTAFPAGRAEMKSLLLYVSSLQK